MSFSLEHIDPVKHHLICGFKKPENEIIADLTYNKSKNNRFVPYRVKDYPAPVSFGDICEFLIKEKWVVCTFGGRKWKKETKRIGFTSTRNGTLSGNRFLERNIGIFNPIHKDKVEKARKNLIKASNACKREVKLVTPEGETFFFQSLTEAGRKFSLNLGELSKCCRGYIQHVKGYTAEYTRLLPE